MDSSDSSNNRYGDRPLTVDYVGACETGIAIRRLGLVFMCWSM